MPHHLFDRVARAAPITVGVGDVGQLPPLEIGVNPWRGDPGYNPYRAWPTDFDADGRTWAAELPAVWWPAAGHLDLWRAFYPEWAELNCVAAPGEAPARPGTPYGEPGNRNLPRQTHQRILATFARGTLAVATDDA